MKSFSKAYSAAAVGVVAFLLSAAPASAKFHNDDFFNTTGNIADDFHLEFESDSPITIGSQCCRSSPTGTFPEGSVTGNGTTRASIWWSGFTVNDGEKIHVGYNVSSDSEIKVTKAFWTLAGFGVFPRVLAASVDTQGGGTDFLVASRGPGDPHRAGRSGPQRRPCNHR